MRLSSHISIFVCAQQANLAVIILRQSSRMANKSLLIDNQKYYEHNNIKYLSQKSLCVLCAFVPLWLGNQS